MIYPVARPRLAGHELRYVSECVRSSWISSQGPFIERFEEGFSTFAGAKYGVATSSGTTALHLVLAALGVGPGDEVIVPDLTFVATVNAVKYCGAEPVLVDCAPGSLNMDLAEVEQRITHRTAAILAVHLYGEPLNHNLLQEIADRHGIYLVYDAAEALGTTIDGGPIGGLGNAATYSFFGNKTLTTGEGGMIVTNDENLQAKARLLRGQGQDPQRRYWFVEVGFNYRMTNVQAAVGVAQLEQVQEFLRDRTRVATTYAASLTGHSLVQLLAPVSVGNRSPWLVTVAVPHEQRDALALCLSQDGIETRPVFHPIHRLPPYRVREAFPHAESISGAGLSLPTYVGLSDDDISWICQQLLGHLERVPTA